MRSALCKKDKGKEDIVLVDIFGRKIGITTKSLAHKHGKLHSAFSIFIHNKDKMLLQRRALDKYHSGGLWSNACCSHPINGIGLMDSVNKRLYEEIGIECVLEEVFQFTYFHKFNNELFEYEYDHVFVGEYDGDIKLNTDEAIEYKWITFKDLENLLLVSPEIFTVWFLIAAPWILKKKF